MEFYEVIKTRRSVRSYRPDAIPKDVLERVLNAARIAPSAGNRQPWKFIVVTDEGLRKELVPACNGQTFVAEAPVIIAGVAAFKTHYDEATYLSTMFRVVDVSIALDHLTLAARAEGLGTCWIGAFSGEAVKKVLSIPDDVQVVALTPLGYPAGKGFAETGSRKPLEEIICHEKFA